MTLSIDALEPIFPFHLSWNEDGLIVRCSDSLRRLWPDLEGLRFAEMLGLQNTETTLSPDACRTLQGQKVTLTRLDGGRCLLEGQLFAEQAGNGCFIGRICWQSAHEEVDCGSSLPVLSVKCSGLELDSAGKGTKRCQPVFSGALTSIEVKAPKVLKKTATYPDAILALDPQALQRLEQRWQLALENGGIAIWEWDVTTGEVVLTPQFYEMLDYNESEWVAHYTTWRANVHPDDWSAVEDALGFCWRGETDHYRNEHRLRCRGGGWKWVRSVGLVVERNPAGDPLRMLGTHMDIDRERRASIALARRSHLVQSLQQVQHRFFVDNHPRQAFDEMLEIAVRQTESEFGFIGEGFEDSAGNVAIHTLSVLEKERTTTTDAAQPKQPRGIFSDGDLAPLFGEVMRTGTVVIFNPERGAEANSREATQPPIEKSVMGIPIFHGIELVGVLGFTNRPGGYDNELIGELDPYLAALSAMILRQREAAKSEEVERRLRSALRQAENANRAKSDFLAVMSHEIRTPLNGIIGMADLLKNSRLSQTQFTQVNAITQSGQALVSIIDDILDFAKIEAKALVLRSESFDLLGMLDSIQDLLGWQAESKGLTFAVIVDPQIPTMIDGDAGRLRQVIVNLLGNALKFTASGEVLLRVTKTGDWLTFAVADTGCGMSRTDQKRVFEPFTQLDSSASRATGGTGLGLAICRRLIELMKGRIQVESRKGEGSIFHFRIPFKTSSKLEVTQDPVGAKAQTAWLLEPNAALCEALRCICQRYGWKVREFHSPADILKALKALGKTVGLLLLDCQWLTEKQMRAIGQTLSRQEEIRPRVVNTRGVCPCNLDEFDEWTNLPRPWRFNSLRALLLNEMEKATQSQPNSTHLNLNVLVAEDNAINADVLMFMLRNLGCKAVHCSNGMQAVEWTQKASFDVVLMDCQMPVVDGYQATHQIRQLEKKHPTEKPLRIIAVTANAFAEDRQRCVEVGMNDHLAKPFTLEKLAAALAPRAAKTATAEANENQSTPSKEFDQLLQIIGLADATKLAKRWFRETKGSLNKIRAACHKADWERVAKEAHTLVGTSGLFGLEMLANTARSAECEARDTHYLSTDSFNALKAALARAQQVLQKRLNTALDEKGKKRSV